MNNESNGDPNYSPAPQQKSVTLSPRGSIIDDLSDIRAIKPKPIYRKFSEDVEFKKPKPVVRKISEDEAFMRSASEDIDIDGYLLQEVQQTLERETQLNQLRDVVLRGLKYKITEDLKIDVISGSMSNLTKFVISRASEDLSRTEAFVLTYRQFGVTPKSMIKTVERIFDKSLKENFSAVLVSELANFLIIWISVAFFTDFCPRKKQSLSTRLFDFLGKLKENNYLFDANRIKLGILKAYSKKIRVTSLETQDGGEAEKGKLKTLLDFSARSISESLTLKESKMYRSIQPPELLNLAWKSEQKYKIAPNVVSIVERSNNVSYWVATEICICKDLRRRILVMKRFLSIAHKCYLLHNFNTTMEILGGLNNVAVQRLKKTWAGALTDKYQAIWDSLTAVMDTKNNYAEYRNHLANIKAQHLPAVPFLGIFLRDLTFVEDGNPNMVSDKHVNFEKIKLLGAVIHEVQQYQKIPYNMLKKQPNLVKYLNESMILPEDPDETVYELSLLVEPIGS